MYMYSFGNGSFKELMAMLTLPLKNIEYSTFQSMGGTSHSIPLHSRGKFYL